MSSLHELGYRLQCRRVATPTSAVLEWVKGGRGYRGAMLPTNFKKLHPAPGAAGKDAVDDLVQPVTIEGCGPLYCLASDLPLLDLAIENAESKIKNSPPRLIAPLDPLIYDRRLTARLWNLDYTWEVYTPPAKRTRGYYALPVLVGHEFVGHVDPKADRENGRLRLVSRRIRRGHRVSPAVGELARFLGLK